MRSVQLQVQLLPSSGLVASAEVSDAVKGVTSEVFWMLGLQHFSPEKKKCKN